MKISVRNADTKTLPNVAVTVATEPGDSGGAPQAFSSDIADPNVADASRPIWIVDEGPKGGDTAYTNTWALGPLKAGETRDFEWKVTAVKPGDYTIDYSVSPGLNGKAKVASGGTTKGTFKVSIADDAAGRPRRATTARSSASPPARTPALRLAYLLDHFPELTETFVSGEIRELLRTGHEVHVEALERARRTPTRRPRPASTSTTRGDDRPGRAAVGRATCWRGGAGGPRSPCGRCASSPAPPAGCARSRPTTSTPTSPPARPSTPCA